MAVSWSDARALCIRGAKTARGLGFALMVFSAACTDVGAAPDTGQSARIVVDKAAREVRLRLVAGGDTVNSGLNFNGAAEGNRTVTIPVGWDVRVTVVNRDRGLTHSAIVGMPRVDLEATPSTPAFDHAVMGGSSEGLAFGDSSTFTFRANHTGHFVLACGVTGHAQLGMWLRFDVEQPGTRPSYR